ncbi:hypothetical protein HG536_0B01700 [Torulaspora globosa]|uniref:Uncharacterized protein n=1 Tax=Torulaspora globosa TaxID=48254 RepID=A0A7G3ZCS1_9SACH|nr:uncharacterized protein HG536_0B01700 [Torulaspora globosa]QLL31307.1 hypothetical protein HG536_0B01700 [Torulaspora globosa]
MLVFKRFASSTGAKTVLDEFFTYHTTNAALKPWIYRPKNANILLTMDLKDPVTKAPIKPRKAVPTVAQKVLNDYVASIQPGSNELLEWVRNWTSVTTRKKALWNYISGSHLQNILVSSFFRVGFYTQVVGLLYSRRRDFVKAGNKTAFDVEHFFNTIIMCSLHRNAYKCLRDKEVAKKKLENAWRQVSNRANHTGLANALIKTYCKQQGLETVPVLEQLAETEIKLDQPADIATAADGELAAFVFANKNKYLVARTIQEFSEAQDVDPKISQFVQDYQAVCQKLGKEDLYDLYKSSMAETFAANQDSTKQEAPETANA